MACFYLSSRNAAEGLRSHRLCQQGWPYKEEDWGPLN